jgi:hypothetical protein
VLAFTLGLPCAFLAGVAICALRAFGRDSIWHAAAVGAAIGTAAAIALTGGGATSNDVPANAFEVALVLVFLPSLFATLACWRLTRHRWEGT